MSNQDDKGIALITGASSGIGALYARRLAARGHDLILVARSAERLGDVARQIGDETGRKVEVLAADLGTSEGQHAAEKLLRSNAAITMLVNNAGFGAVSALVDSDVDRMEAMIDLNVTALTRLTYAAIPQFVARGAGTIVNISSIVAIGPEIMNGVYGASKAFVLAFTQSLHHEVGAKGVRVQAVLPGGTATDFWGTAGHGDFVSNPSVMAADAMVDAALAGLDAGEVVTIPPLQDGSWWDEYDARRRLIASNLAHAEPAPRYRNV